MTENLSKTRLPGPDIVRLFACMFVVFEHFFLNIGYYDAPLAGKIMLGETFFRWMFIICIPLFLMLTGYFKYNKGIEKSHYMSLIPIVIAYVLISVPKMILYNYLYGTIYSPMEMLKNIGNYNIAWYTGLYIGLIVLIPFLNKLWKGLNGRREQNILIISLAVLCAVYPVFNYVSPVFYVSLYPVMYYFLGTYIRVNQPKVNKLLLLVIFTCVISLETCISFFGAKGGPFNWNLISTADSGYGGIFIMISSLCLFLMFYDVDVKGKIIRKILEIIGGVTYEVYLFAGMYDALIYGYFKRTVTSAADFAAYFPVTAVLCFIVAVISSIIYKSVYKAIKRLVVRER